RNGNAEQGDDAPHKARAPPLEQVLQVLSSATIARAQITSSRALRRPKRSSSGRRESSFRHLLGVTLSSHLVSGLGCRGFSSYSCGDLVEILNTQLGCASTPKHEHRTEDPTGLVGILGGVGTPISGGDLHWSVDIATRQLRAKHTLSRWF